MKPTINSQHDKQVGVDLAPHEHAKVNKLIEEALGTTTHKKLDAKDLQDLMAIKAEKEASFKAKKSLYTAIGMAMSLLFVIIAFEWKFYDDKELIVLDYDGDRFEELAEIPLTEQPPPPPPSPTQTVQVIFNEVPDEEVIEDIKVDLDVEITTEMTISDDILNPFEEDEPEEEIADQIFTIVEQNPEPVGGYAAFYAFVAENLEYPKQARKAAVEGKIYAKFVVEPDGSITNIQVVKGIGYGCDEAAVDVIAKSPKWKAGKQRGRPVRVGIIVPIVFKMVD